MKNPSNVKLDNTLKYAIIFCLITFLVYSCGKKTEIIPPKAEITNIYNVTDSSANVDVIVTQQSNAGWIHYFNLLIDSTSIDGPYYRGSVQTINLAPGLNVRNLNNSYTSKISNLKSRTRYYLHLSFFGTFDIGGPNEDYVTFIGERKSFITN